MARITLRNDYHNTRVNVLVTPRRRLDDSWEITLTPSQKRQVYRALCGIVNCTCGGIRGTQTAPDGDPLIVIG